MRPPVDEGRIRDMARALGRVSRGHVRLLDVHHFDPDSQALSKIERGFAQDLDDVRSMVDGGLVERERLGELFDAIEPELYRYPAIDPAAFRRKVEAALSGKP